VCDERFDAATLHLLRERVAACAAAAGRDERPGQGRNAPSRPASAEARMIAARVANGPAVALAAATEASGRSAAAVTATTMPAAQMARRRGSRDDVILADLLVFLGVMSCVIPPCIGKFPA